MSAIFALFEDPQALEAARAHFRESAVIPGVPAAEADDVEQVIEQTYQGKAPLDSLKLVEGRTLEDELVERGVPREQSRFFADALRSGSSLLIARGDLEAERGRLIEAGAGYVSSDQAPA